MPQRSINPIKSRNLRKHTTPVVNKVSKNHKLL